MFIEPIHGQSCYMQIQPIANVGSNHLVDNWYCNANNVQILDWHAQFDDWFEIKRKRILNIYL